MQTRCFSSLSHGCSLNSTSQLAAANDMYRRVAVISMKRTVILADSATTTSYQAKVTMLYSIKSGMVW